MNVFESLWLKEGKYITGSDKPTIADISAICEIAQLDAFGFDFTPYPKTLEWKTKMMQIEEIKTVFIKARESSNLPKTTE